MKLGAPGFEKHNHLVGLTSYARRLPGLLLAVLAAAVMLTAGQALFGIPMLVIAVLVGGVDPREVLSADSDSAVRSGLLLSLVLVSAFAGIYVLLWLWLRWYERRPFWTLGFERSAIVQKIMMGALSGLLMMGVAVGLLAVAGFVALEQYRSERQGPGALLEVLIPLVGWSAQGPAEELVCRGWLLPVLAARYRLWIGLVVSTLVFALGHALNPNVGPAAIVNLGLYGLFAALYALREGGIWGVCANHAVWNWSQANLFGFEVSGNRAGGGTLVNLMETGPDELTGGPFGPEGGLAVTVVLLAAILIVLLAPVRQVAVRGP